MLFTILYFIFRQTGSELQDIVNLEPKDLVDFFCNNNFELPTVNSQEEETIPMKLIEDEMCSCCFSQNQWTRQLMSHELELEWEEIENEIWVRFILLLHALLMLFRKLFEALTNPLKVQT